MPGFRNMILATLALLLFSATAHASNEKHATRSIENGTKVQLIIGDAIIPAVLNESKTSKALLAKLPHTVNLQKYTHGFCGHISVKLPIDQDHLQDGWLDGDIVYSRESNELAILYKNEKISKDLYKNLVTLGVVSSPLSTIENLDRSVSIKIALD